MADINSAQRDLAQKVMGKPGVTGVAIGEKRGKPCLKVYVSGAASGIPKSVGGYAVVTEKSETFRKL
ncbi:MAG: hypothetical protein HN645_01125 [Gemmatimonadales bacterium]|nr:hypothetical protein [Gemmatimonadales bacterium]MBT6374168.1 hypothetical protein [Gemmatimonadales bacterium]MBT7501508.1 hypothetical protein [Gemmatimonadales bacterium]